MELIGFFFVLFVAAFVIVAVVHRRAAAGALGGVSFVAPHAPALVAAALDKTHRGAAAALLGAVSGVSVRAVGSGSFSYQSKFGDEGHLVITKDPAGALVQARTTSLHVGAGQKLLNTGTRGLWGLSVEMTHVLFRLVGVAPGATHMNRWQNALQLRITRDIAKAIG